ncbi:hypothetical protein [Duncaniella muris]|jgi:hypothetical protein|uniref:hypothetical protein n=1 Tax=Duncaniella muris TaxID=2094150 RepID=UPI0026767C62|nr:hypothetical protein [Duncaniella muris]
MRKNKTTIIVAVFLVAWLLSTVAFIVLKCFGVLSWSWWWLLVPVLGTPALALLAVGTVALCTIFITLTSTVNKL